MEIDCIANFYFGQLKTMGVVTSVSYSYKI